MNYDISVSGFGTKLKYALPIDNPWTSIFPNCDNNCLSFGTSIFQKLPSINDPLQAVTDRMIQPQPPS